MHWRKVAKIMKKSLSYAAYLKSPYRSIKHSTYFEIYDDLFSCYRGKKITFVEIGVLGGGSLFMWREFFGPKARIVGVDLNPDARKWEAHGFEIHIGSQSDENFWGEFKKKVGPIDVVLDDGGHTYDQQIITTEMLLESIVDGGILVVEDTHTSYMDRFGPKKYSFIEYTKNMIDLINKRFGGFDEQSSERRVWSVKIYESVVAFFVNKEASYLTSEPTDNDGENDLSVDYRFGVRKTFGTRLNKRLHRYFPKIVFKSQKYFK
jgi:cephalosporin hydroxylase